MPIDPMIARGYPVNAAQMLFEGQRDKVRRTSLEDENTRRNTMLQMDQQAIAAQGQQAADDDAEWDAAYAAKDWGAMAQLDPQTTKVLWDFEQSKNPQAKAPNIGTVSPSDYTPESVAQFQQTGDYSALRRYVAPQQPREPKEPPQPQLKEIVLPDGRVQSQWLRPGESQGTPVGEPVKPNQDKPMSAKDANTARVKLTQVAVARKQLQDAQTKYAALKGSLSAGPGGGLLPTPAGKAYDAAIDSMRSSISALTRVPGVGAMSDYETRLDQAKFPTRNNYEAVGEQQLQALADQLDTIESSYREMLGGRANQTTAAPEPKVQRTEAPKAAIEYLKAHPESKTAFFKKYGYLPR